MSAAYSNQHPHEPEIPPVLDEEGRCRVCQLLVAGQTLYDVIVWMSGSPSFSPEGEAHEGWLTARTRANDAHATFFKAGHEPS